MISFVLIVDSCVVLKPDVIDRVRQKDLSNREGIP